MGATSTTITIIIALMIAIIIVVVIYYLRVLSTATEGPLFPDNKPPSETSSFRFECPSSHPLLVGGGIFNGAWLSGMGPFFCATSDGKKKIKLNQYFGQHGGVIVETSSGQELKAVYLRVSKQKKPFPHFRCASYNDYCADADESYEFKELQCKTNEHIVGLYGWKGTGNNNYFFYSMGLLCKKLLL
ncbi:hypothetical protein Gasu2_34370 [Galdieria sulphuraria]|nr:hypothetical protein Gasu2_34370 [Galdieria sulphuraria]